MKPSLVNYFFAYAVAVATCGGAIILGLFAYWRTASLLFSGQAQFLSICAIVTAVFLGLLLGYFLIGYPLFFIGRRVNGGPFYEGDLVRILRGPHKNRIVRVYEVWAERNQVRVDLGKQERSNFRDVFSVLQVCREQLSA